MCQHRGRSRERGATHPVELVAPPAPVPSAAEVRAAHPALLEPFARRLPVLVRRLLHAAGLQAAVGFADEVLERRHVPPRPGAVRAREKDAEGGKTEAAVALFRGRPPAEDAHALVGCAGEVTGMGGRGIVSERGRWSSAGLYAHYVLLDEVEPAGQAIEFQVAKVDIWGNRL